MEVAEAMEEVVEAMAVALVIRLEMAMAAVEAMVEVAKVVGATEHSQKHLAMEAEEEALAYSNSHNYSAYPCHP